MNRREVSHFIAVVLFEFFFFACYMFFNRSFLKIVPHPLFVSFTNSLFVLPSSFFVSWASHNFPTSFNYLIPPRECFIWMGADAFLESLITILYNLSYYGSALDFVIIMRLSGLLWNGFLGYVFLGERLSRLSVFSLILIIVGNLIIFSNFQWSVALFTSKTQIVIQLLTILLMSISSLITKKILAIIGQLKTNFRILDYLAWGSLLSLPSTLLISIWKEPTSWTQFSSIVTRKMIGLTVLGMVLHQCCHYMIAQIHKLASLISLGVLAQVKLLGTLCISHFLYGETHWDRYNFSGLGFLVIGGVIYSMTRIEGGERGHRHSFNNNNSNEERVETSLLLGHNSDCDPTLP
jgi:drug/metabolite transporter (DMT)-like permease